MDKRVEETVNRRARGLDRAFDILDALREAGRPLRPNEIAAAMGAPRSTIYEIVAALVKLDVLEAADTEGRVFLVAACSSTGRPMATIPTCRAASRWCSIALPPKRRRPPSSVSSTETSTRSR